MVVIRGSRLGTDGMERPNLSDNEIHEMITTHVTFEVREAILEVFGSIKTTLINMFDEHYATIAKAAAVVTTATISATKFHGGGSI